MTPKLKTFLERGLSTVILLAVLGGVLWVNKPIGYGVLICLLCNLTTWEWFHMLRGSGTNRNLVLVGGGIYPWAIMTMALTCGELVSGNGVFRMMNVALAGLILYAIIAFICELVSMDYRGKTAAQALCSVSRSILAFIYPVWLFSFSLFFIGCNDAVSMLLWLILFTKMSDIWAYVSGVLLGGKFIKRKFSPVVSPKKTWEGIIGSIILTLACSAFLFPVLFGVGLVGVGEVVFYLAVGIPLFFIAVAGDLAGSLIKRGLAVKDSGSLLPGIGGIFDLIDSPAFTVSCVTVLVCILSVC